jgi:hypothetical protein
MHHPSIARHAGNTFYNEFGGAKPSYMTRNSGYAIMPSSTTYGVDGKGRDGYISLDNGGLAAMHHPDL